MVVQCAVKGQSATEEPAELQYAARFSVQSFDIEKIFLNARQHTFQRRYWTPCPSHRPTGPPSRMVGAALAIIFMPAVFVPAVLDGAWRPGGRIGH
jgi:hypothetical protein